MLPHSYLDSLFPRVFIEKMFNHHFIFQKFKTGLIVIIEIDLPINKMSLKTTKISRKQGCQTTLCNSTKSYLKNNFNIHLLP